MNDIPKTRRIDQLLPAGPDDRLVEILTIHSGTDAHVINTERITLRPLLFYALVNTSDGPLFATGAQDVVPVHVGWMGPTMMELWIDEFLSRDLHDRDYPRYFVYRCSPNFLSAPPAVLRTMLALHDCTCPIPLTTVGHIEIDHSGRCREQQLQAHHPGGAS